MKRNAQSRGFTLIELLVVVAIIGALSSVVVASLNSARLKSRDAAIKSAALQLRTIMTQEFADTGSYAAIKSGGAWKAAGGSCTATSFSGNYATKANQVCENLMNQLPTGTACATGCLYFVDTVPSSSDRFTIMAYLPGASAAAGTAQYLCYGSSGRTSVGPVTVGGINWGGAGCYANP